MSPAVASIAPVVPVAASSASSSAGAPSEGFDAALSGAINEQSGKNQGSNGEAASPGDGQSKPQGTTETGNIPVGDAPPASTSQLLPAISPKTPVTVSDADESEGSAADQAQSAMTARAQVHPSGATGASSVATSPKGTGGGKHAATEGDPIATVQPVLTVPVVAPPVAPPSPSGAGDPTQAQQQAQVQAQAQAQASLPGADAQAGALAGYQPAVGAFASTAGASQPSVSSALPRATLLSRLGAALKPSAATGSTGSTAGAAAATSASPTANITPAAIAPPNTDAAAAAAAALASARRFDEQRNDSPGHSQAAPISSIQPPAGASPLEKLSPASVVAAPPPAAPGQPLQQQLAQPMIRLASAENGDHTMVVRIAPDDLGPVTIQAHVSDAGVKIELFAPNEAGREAIKQILPELRRDLTSTASTGSVNVSDQNAPGADSNEHAREPRATPQDGGGRASRDLPNDPAPSPLRRSSAHALDVFA